MAKDLNVYQDGKGRNLMEWIREKGENMYTDIGKRTWRVPPIKFNMQKLVEQKLSKVENGQQPMRIEGTVLGQPNLTDQETNRAENVVCGAFESLSNCLVHKGLGSAMFLISNFEYDNYLNKLSNCVTRSQTVDTSGSHTSGSVFEAVSGSESTQASGLVVKLPKDVANRGELDILILHQEAGVILVQTKAVGYNFQERPSHFDQSSSIRTAIEKAGEQLARDRNVMLYIMNDLGLKNDQMTAVVALPNLPRSVLQNEMSSDLKHKVKHEYSLDLDKNFLCEEDFKPDIDGCYGLLEIWWRETLLKMAKKLDLPTMQQIAYRTVGLLSTVSVWSYAQPRIEVRNLNQAAWETGHRYTQVVLSPQQVELLKHEDQYMYLWGPAGSGKTLLLSLKGRQWLRRDWNVAIVNTRLGSRGRTVGQVIETTINKTEGLRKKVMRIDLDLMDNEETLLSIVSEHVRGETFHFLLDEIAWVKETEKLLHLLKKSYPYSSIWCAGMLIECQPEGFEAGSLEVILRCPPSVQRVLRIVDNRDERCQLYKLDSAKAGLPTDGLKAFFVIHSQHGDPSVQPYDCRICGQKLSDILINHLNMRGRITNRISSSQEPTLTQQQQNSQSFCLESVCRDQTELNQVQKLDSSVGSDTMTNQITNQHSSNQKPALTAPQDSNKSFSFKSVERNHSEFDLIHKLGSSVGSDSGIDNTYMDVEIPLDSPETGSVVIPKNKTRKKQNRNKKKHPVSFENNNPDENAHMTVSKTINNNNPNVTTGCSPHSEVYNPEKFIATKDLNKEEVPIVNSVTKSRNRKCNKTQNSTKNTDTLTPEQDIENIHNQIINNQNERDCKENSNNAQNQNRIGANVGERSKKKKAGGKKSHYNNMDGSAEGSNYPQLNFSDAILPVTVPRGWHHYNARGYWSISREALAQEMVILGSSPLCEELYNSGVPLKVEEQMVMNAEGKELENNFVLCPVGAVHGLEYKVVVCVPSARHLPEYMELSQGIRNGSMEPKMLVKRTQFGSDYLKRLDQLAREEMHFSMTDNNYGPKIDKVRISTHVAEEGAPFDHLYEPISEKEAQLISQENLLRLKATEPDKPYVAHKYTEEEIKRFKDELCGQCSNKDTCVCQYFTPEELAAVHRLESWDKAYVLMCASRCTSTLVLVLP
ncbi:unnamed protein product [Candidula unifasciata]|uniref:Uncharacterized protein n=1 Tax=Candidula unifasciata TaxID=100452 RepID=A0A8S3YLM5_9EUPU|nr:unnamed protein product [Candidula unifasciata]